MFSKQGLRNFLKIFLVLSLSSLVFTGQLKLLCKFIGVELPYRLKYKDVVFEKGKYNLEAVKDRNAPRYYLRIKKGRKVLCLLRGEQLAYTSHGMGKVHDPNIPDKPTLKIKKNLEEKVIYFTVETGKKNRMAPYQKLRFKLEYEE
jgi:hypothetical protein